MAASKLLRQSRWRGYEDASCLCVLIDLGVTTLLLVFCARAIRRDGSLQLSGFSNALTLLALLRVLGNMRSVFGVVVGQAFLLARGLVGALGLLFTGIRLHTLAQTVSFRSWVYQPYQTRRETACPFPHCSPWWVWKGPCARSLAFPRTFPWIPPWIPPWTLSWAPPWASRPPSLRSNQYHAWGHLLRRGVHREGGVRRRGLYLG